MAQVRFKKQSNNSSKKQLITSQFTKSKSKHSSQKVVQPQTTITKNLMKEFNAAEARSSFKKQNNYHQQKSVSIISNQQEDISEASQLYQSSLSTSKSILRVQPESINFQLPKSYILAMKGLQQGVNIRQKQIRKLKKELKDDLMQIEQLKGKIKQQLSKREIGQQKIDQLVHQNKFLKQLITDLKQQAINNTKSKLLIEQQLTSQKNISQQRKIQIDKIKKQFQLLLKQHNKLKEQSHLNGKYMNQRKSQYEELNRKQIEQYVKSYSQVSTLKTQILKLKQINQKDKAQIISLKCDIRFLNENLASEQQRFKQQLLLSEKQHLDRLELEVSANRQILQELNLNKMIANNQEKDKKKFNTSQDQTAKKEFKTIDKVQQKEYINIQDNLKQPKEVKQIKHRQQRSSTFQYRPSIQKKTPISKIERSTSRLRQTNDSQHPQRRQLIGQMRQLMRHQKELISLNYQIEMIEKGMVCEGGARREEMQKTYSKMRKNIEKKQAQIRDLKLFLDNPRK